MPRYPGGDYYLPPGTDAAPDTTIESTKFNVFTHDVEEELNRLIDHLDEIEGSTATGLALKVSKAGDTMTGHLTLPTGPADANAVRKDYVTAYVDGKIAAIPTPDLSTKVSKSGDTMTGNLTIDNAHLFVNGDMHAMRPSAPTTGVVYLGNTDRYLYYNGTSYAMPVASLQIGSPIDGNSAARVDWVQSSLGSYLPKSGGQMTGQITTPESQGMAYGGSAGTIEVGGNTATGGWAAMTFHVHGAFACNFGLNQNGNFYMGGWSHGATWHQFYSSRDFAISSYLSNGRLPYAGDLGAGGSPSTIQENMAHGVMTGHMVNESSIIVMWRYRYVQGYTSGWFTFGYAGP